MVADSGRGEIQAFTLPVSPAVTTLNSLDHFYNYLTLYESASGTLGLDLSDQAQSMINSLREENPSAFSNLLATLAKRQVDFIRGAEVGNATVGGIVDAVRSRIHGGTPWRLGDIVYSSPVAVGRPSENYHLIYNDTTYERFLKKYLNRRQVVYAGANDGMLHAFNGGFWNSGTRTFDVTRDGQTGFQLGQELWAYVPYNLLPHLKWLMLPDYGEKLHVAYMDLTPKVFDARIFFMSDGITSVDEGKYPGGWGTILVAGMRLGGAAMEVDIDKTDGNTFNNDIDRNVSSAYVIMDVTDPESPPNVMAEISMLGQGFTTCVPAVMPMSSPNANTAERNRWYMVFGSGPADSSGYADRSKLAAGTSDQPGKLYILDLSALFMEKIVKTVGSDGLLSAVSRPFAFTEESSLISDPICVDLDIGSKSETGKFKTDLIYFGTMGGEKNAQTGRMHRVWTDNAEPRNWTTSTLIDATGPVTAAPTVAMDETDRLWIFFGTGRFLNRADIPQSSPMSFYGIREPEVNGVKSWETVFAHNLFDSNKIAVTKGTCGEGKFSENCAGIIQANADSKSTKDWAWLSSSVDSAAGWKHTFTEATERVLTSAAVLGGSVIFTSYIPSLEACSANGSSYLWALFYKTGTPYFWPTLENHHGNLASFIELGQGPSTSPILHLGERSSATAITQTISGKLPKTKITTPFTIKSGSLFWRKNTD
jgi:type IV pilus assembly protein PilY1